MRIMIQIKSIITAGIATLVLSGCGDEGTTATGVGVGVGGNWSGELLRNNVVFASFTMSLSQTQSNPDDPFAPHNLTGVFNTNNECIGSGNLEGPLIDDSITVSVTTPNGKLLLAGEAGNSSMSGSWSNASSSNSTTSCNFGGIWRARR